MPRRIRALVLIGLGVCAVTLILAAWLDTAQAQNPFGPGPRAAAPDGVVGWILAKQSEFYRGLSSQIRAAKADGRAVWSLLALSFAYGVFHAAGPGHGKAVISSYVVANGETWRRGVALSFASAILQALVAVLIVGVAAVLLGATSRTMNGTIYWIEVVSYGLIALLGARLLWVKGRSFLNAWSRYRSEEAAANPGSGSAPVMAHAHAHAEAHSHSHHTHDHGHSHARHSHAHEAHRHHGHGHDQHHHSHDHQHGPSCGCDSHDHDDHASAWGHAHAPEPQELAGPGGWKRGLSAIIAVGLRPCSGAILVLVFSLAQGLFWAGVAATFLMGIGTAITVAAIAAIAVGARGIAQRLATSKPGPGMLALRGLEVAAALLVLLFGIALLTGYVASERMFAA